MNNATIEPNIMKYKKYLRVSCQPTSPKLYLVNNGARK